MAIKHNPQNDGTSGNIGQADYNADHAIDAGTIGTTEIAANAVTTAKLAVTAVTPGSYMSANMTVGADGRITAAANGTGGGITNAAPNNKLMRSDGTNAANSSITDDLTTVTIGAALAHQATIGTEISPAAITGTVNDWNPTGLATASTILVTSSSSAISLTGLVGGVSGRKIRIVNADAANTLTLKNQNAGSSSADRFLTQYGRDIVLAPGVNASATLEYMGSAPNDFWTVVAFSTNTPPAVTLQGNSGCVGSFTAIGFANDGAGKWTSGAVTPNTNVVGKVGDLYTWTGGSAGTTLWVKESGANTNTGWVSK